MIKLKVLAEHQLYIAKMMISLFDRVENTVRKRENAGYQHFLLFPVFSKAFLQMIIKSQDCVVKG